MSQEVAVFYEITFTCATVMPALVAGIHDFEIRAILKSWMPDMTSGMTMVGVDMFPSKNKTL